MFLVLITWNKERRWVQNFILLPQGFESFYLGLPRAKWCNLVCVSKRLSKCWLVFVLLGLMILWVMGVGFYNTCIVSRKWNDSRVIQRRYGWVYKTLRLCPLAVNIVLWLWLPHWILWVSNFRFPFYEICVQHHWGHKIVRPSWGLRHWWSKFSYRLDGILTCFSILILWALYGKPMSGRKKKLFC